MGIPSVRLITSTTSISIKIWKYNPISYCSTTSTKKKRMYCFAWYHGCVMVIHKHLLMLMNRTIDSPLCRDYVNWWIYYYVQIKILSWLDKSCFMLSPFREHRLSSEISKEDGKGLVACIWHKSQYGKRNHDHRLLCLWKNLTVGFMTHIMIVLEIVSQIRDCGFFIYRTLEKMSFA